MSLTTFSSLYSAIPVPSLFTIKQPWEPPHLFQPKIVDKKMSRAWTCTQGLLAGTAGSLATKNPIPLFIGLSGCLPGANAQVPIGDEFQVNTFATGSQFRPSAATLNNGMFVVTWVSDGQDGDAGGIFGQLFDTSGTKVGDEFQVNTNAANVQDFPSVTGLTNGNIVVTWSSINGDGSGYGVVGQVLDSTGSKIGGEFPVNTNTFASQWKSSVTSTSNGGFAIAWQSDQGQDGDGAGIYGQLFDASGAKINGEFQANTYSSGHQIVPKIATLSDGRLVILWEGDDKISPTYSTIYGQLFTPNATKIGNEFKVSSVSGGLYESDPSVTSLNSGFVADWTSTGRDGDQHGIFGQLFNASGAKAGVDYPVNTFTTSRQYRSSTASSDSGRLATAWTSLTQDGDGAGVYGQFFDPTGAKAGNEFQANAYTTSSQTNPSVVFLDSNRIVVAWKSTGQDGDAGGIFARIFSDTSASTSSSTTEASTTTSTSPTSTSASPTTSTSPSSTSASPTNGAPSSPVASSSSRLKSGYLWFWAATLGLIRKAFSR
ncbi:MAG: hypothetical protein P0S96_02630 [Simkaniaceae bacterium]|nr:hypothetical protein [Candidatus Sacchlamyda saccharinae]